MSYPIFNRVRIAMVALVAMIALEALIAMVALIAMNALIASSSKCLLNKISEVEIEETRPNKQIKQINKDKDNDNDNDKYI